jgi:hypothetical protein
LNWGDLTLMVLLSESKISGKVVSKCLLYIVFMAYHSHTSEFKLGI